MQHPTNMQPAKKAFFFFAWGILCLLGSAVVLITPSAEAGRYGILEQKAPPLTAQYWVNAYGRPGKPFVLEDYRGRVVYLLFFQDW